MGVLNYNDLIAQANLQPCDPRDSACVADNVAKQAAVEDFWVQHMATGVPDDTKLTFTPLTRQQVSDFATPGGINVGNIVPTGILQVQGTPIGRPNPDTTGGGVSYSPSLSFSVPRSGSLYPGDAWTIKITGARPNSSVYVVGGKNGAQDTTLMGRTDTSGNFSLSGQITSDQIGSWSELWTAGGVQAGTFSFVVAAPVQKTPQGQIIVNSSGTTQQPLVPQEVSSPFSWSGTFAGIPAWGWALAVGGALFAFGGGRGR